RPGQTPGLGAHGHRAVPRPVLARPQLHPRRPEHAGLRAVLRPQTHPHTGTRRGPEEETGRNPENGRGPRPPAGRTRPGPTPQQGPGRRNPPPARRNQGSQGHHPHPPDQHDYDEATTRTHIIDLLLREAGWDLTNTEDREYPLTGLPTLSGKGRAD